MTPNQKFSESLSVLGTIDPVSAAVGTLTTAWVPVSNHFAIGAQVFTGVLGASATVDAKIQQAQDASGTGAKDVGGKAITQLQQAASGSNRQSIVNLKAADLDVEGGFSYVRLSLTVGVAASQVAAQLVGAFPRFADAAMFNQAAVAAIN